MLKFQLNGDHAAMYDIVWLVIFRLLWIIVQYLTEPVTLTPRLTAISTSVGGPNSLQILFTDFDCRNDQNWKISHNSFPDSWPVCFTVGGAKKYVWGLSPWPMPGAPHCMHYWLLCDRLAGNDSDIPVASHFFVILLKCSSVSDCIQLNYDSLAFVLPQWHTPGSTECLVCIDCLLLFIQYSNNHTCTTTCTSTITVQLLYVKWSCRCDYLFEQINDDDDDDGYRWHSTSTILCSPITKIVSDFSSVIGSFYCISFLRCSLNECLYDLY